MHAEITTGRTDSVPSLRRVTRRLIFVALLILLAGCREADKTPATSPPAPVSPSRAEARTPPPQTSYADVVERVGPGVVTIRAARRVRPPRQHPFFNDPLFREFFNGVFQGTRSAAPRVQLALGSGVVVQSNGTILTNYHVIDGAEAIKVEMTDHRVFDAKVVGSDAPSDLAVLKIDADKLTPLTLGDSDQVRVGDVALALGNPLGIGQTVTAGIISAKGRYTGLSNGSFEDFLQTDAPINRGNSGGALVNTRGELIGINSQILSPSGGNIGIGFAIPSNMARTVMDQLLKTGKVHRGQLGVEIQPVTPELAKRLGLAEPRGVLVDAVLPNGAAATAGIRQGDVLVVFDGQPVEDGNTLRNRIASTPPGTRASLTVFRDGHEQKIEVTLTEYNPSERAG